MRHIRDPITGYCIICEKNNIRHFVAPNELDVDDSASVHGSDRPRSSRRGYESGKKTIHVTSNESGSGKSRPSSSTSLSSDTSNDSLRRSRYTSRSTSKLIIIENDQGGNSSPPPRYGGSSSRSTRSPSPTLRNKRGTSPKRGRYTTSDPESGCCGKAKSFCKGNGKSKVLDESTAYNDGTDRCCGYRNFETASFGAGTWGIRRWCAPLLTLLVLGALAGIATGIYFGVKSAKDKAAANQKIVSVIKNSQVVYIIVGIDQPCNKLNNASPRTSPTPLPNCNSITTRLVPATKKFVPPTDPDWVVALDAVSDGAEIHPLPIVGLLLLIWAARAMLVDRNFISGFVEI